MLCVGQEAFRQSPISTSQRSWRLSITIRSGSIIHCIGYSFAISESRSLFPAQRFPDLPSYQLSNQPSESKNTFHLGSSINMKKLYKDRASERGSAGIKFLLVFLVIVVAANAGINYVPIAYQGASFKQEMDTAVV